MQKNLVIVESPAKAKTIEKFLGKDFKVLSSYGHIRDLKKKEFSIDVEKDFEPHYEIPTDKKKVVAQLKEEAEKAETVWLASDEDREGEAIAWHLYEVLKLKPENTKRIVFHEITKGAILKAIENPRNIDINLVDAQQARRILDRIVGFELSPVLWKKVKPALSAGRVQSVAVRLIVEREREIHAFRTEASYRVTAIFLVPDADGKQVEMKAELARRIKTKAEAQKLLESCKSAAFIINDITTRPVKRTPAAPFTTSTLQQEAARKLGFTVAQTMMVAQRLYESGNITYMRTDSVNLSEYAVNSSKEAVMHLMGERYVFPRHFATKTKGAQEAHEAIRPTYMENTKIEGSPQERKLYELIWKRTIASQMADAELEKTTVNISIGNEADTFTATGEIVKFDGFLRVYRESYDDDSETSEDEARLLPPLKKGQKLQYEDITATERFTQHPARYTEASLVRKLEELGIGRPSTYAPTISTIQQREYVVKGEKPGEERAYNVLSLQNGQIADTTRTEITGAEKAKLLPTDTGIVVNDFLIEYFPNILDFNFTANVEKQFDEIAEGDKQWTAILNTFYKNFHPSVESTLATKSAHKAGERILGTDPSTGKQVSVKIGRFGPVVQIGTAEDEEKPRFAQLNKDMSIETVTLEEALDLFKLPRTLGEYEDKTVTVGTGRFGPYIQHNRVYVSLPKTADPMTVTLEEAIELIQEKQQAEAQRHIKKFEEEPELEIMNGRYGPYVAYKGSNYKIPKDIVPQDLSLTACLEIVKLQSEKTPSSKSKRGAKAATKTAKATTSKTTVKKTKATATKTAEKK
ncbi:type I DNA topoisomerase [Bacteroides helcogenes]|uniref:DNA topoisomerase 1 n=1 Tax=Bacteroides helcogenes (strain ATCC 35417 / DSM 20613 / JCM 6297 / CCUG 15421 / P 36-108) TaxID=693979 RepID=E6SQ41_BACT6|nr:type I DNA topoisomerase [Bacteroides helcogenes]ADV42946.1 DNA topoisomerase I [Bacteroides helcogenes P 36-108]MDY5237011.1 type I DNA topoisomerase [Bacteroides helcogenes]